MAFVLTPPKKNGKRNTRAIHLEHDVARRAADFGDEKVVDVEFIVEGEALEGEEFAIEGHPLRRRIVAHLEEDVVDPKLDRRSLQANVHVTTAHQRLPRHVADAIHQLTIQIYLGTKRTRRKKFGISDCTDGNEI